MTKWITWNRDHGQAEGGCTSTSTLQYLVRLSSFSRCNDLRENKIIRTIFCRQINFDEPPVH